MSFYDRNEDSSSRLTDASFNAVFSHLDHYKDPIFMYLTSGGLEATRKSNNKYKQGKWEDSEDENASGGEG